MAHWLAVVLLVWTNLFSASFFPNLDVTQAEPSAADQPGIEDPGVTYQFGGDITFNARLTSADNVQEILLSITPAGQPTVLQTIVPDASLEIHQAIASSQLSLRPFSAVSYHYQINLKDGKTLPGSDYSFRYEDTRFTWQALEENDFQVYWYGRGNTFGTSVVNWARQGLKKANTILPVTLKTSLKIYVYSSLHDLQAAWPSNNRPWVVGFAEPDQNQILISIPTGPEQELELERQVPHEILHILQYQVVGEGFSQQPIWLIEGMASLAELYPNPDYESTLNTAVKNNQLLPIDSLCESFPRETNGAYKAYAESESFVRFLYTRYGSSGMMKLMEQYKNGLSCDEGVNAAFGTSLGQLEYRWKQETLGVDMVALVLQNLAPYLVLLVVILAPLILAILPGSRRRKMGGVAPGVS